jgi:peptidoglycan/xylan/chitin deacetylase (PgdA/CDA1 family)
MRKHESPFMHLHGMLECRQRSGVMRRWLGMFVMVVLATAPVAAEAPRRQMALTIDDLPSQEVARASETDLAARNARIVAALQGTNAIGFVNEDKLEVDGKVAPKRVQWLRDWLAAGIDLGNHTYNHNGLHATPIADYEQSILDGERVLRPLMAEFKREPRWFRHPYLQTGQDDAVRTRLDGFLEQHGYRVAPVTVDNGEWIYARAYLLLLEAGKRDEARALISDYIDYMEAKCQFFEQASKRLFGREIPQVLLFHANALNADALPALLDRLRKRGYDFVDLDTALADSAYQHADGYRGRAGISWLHRWAMAEKKSKVFYEGEPAVPQQVLDIAGVDGE